jgi:type IV pilus assembly protein PilF
MTKRTLATLVLALAATVAVAERGKVVTASPFDWTTVTFTEATTDNAVTDVDNGNETEVKKKRGNGFVRALGAPFRALGRLFGRGKKHEQTARGITEKEAAKFESTKVTRITDARSVPPTAAKEPSVSPVDMHLQAGRDRLSAGDLNGAITELTQVASGKDSAEVQNLLGMAYEGKNLRERALESFKRAVKLEKKNPLYLNNYGFLLFKNNEFEAATKYLKQGTKLSPGDARIWNNLALAQCERGKFDDALESFVHAVGAFNGRLNIAAQLSRRGYAKDAIEHLEKAQALKPNSTEVLTKLVDLYAMTGRVTDAENARRSLIALKTFAEANK